MLVNAFLGELGGCEIVGQAIRSLSERGETIPFSHIRIVICRARLARCFGHLDYAGGGRGVVDKRVHVAVAGQDEIVLGGEIRGMA